MAERSEVVTCTVKVNRARVDSMRWSGDSDWKSRLYSQFEISAGAFVM